MCKDTAEDGEEFFQSPLVCVWVGEWVLQCVYVRTYVVCALYHPHARMTSLMPLVSPVPMMASGARPWLVMGQRMTTLQWSLLTTMASRPTREGMIFRFIDPVCVPCFMMCGPCDFSVLNVCLQSMSVHSKGAVESARKLNWKTLQVGSFRCTCTVTAYICTYAYIHSIVLFYILYVQCSK